MITEQPFLSEIWVYPVKSLGGVRLETAQVEERGLQYDRRWLIVDGNGTFLTQRAHPEMALIDVAIREDSLLLSHRGNPANAVTVPLSANFSREVTVKIWKDMVPAQAVSKAADDWLSDHLQRQVRIVALSEHADRRSPDIAGQARRLISFADDFPFHLTSESSLGELNSRLPEPVGMNRFRPNFVITGATPFAEDTWKSIRISDLVFDLISPCERCAVVTINQETGRKGLEPLRTLSKFRRKERHILFGQNVTGRGNGIIRTGDAVQIIR
ncbi:MOSC domain-containing protein [Dyadobacter aurulentus]|uniref:MOSC domain-containing protein n=1 Tax=Dyadobacter sp. UC 10 TaxID=2605428 RepID=UPI0011F33CB3|nr:MOSC N-terminal beta barrel domain-containing protein [Dyadobacter sp. UC 10]KAA0989112.1 MOSC domain-containing protein [Dyadobacter sp. UC 10]